ncbi:MAG: hypothetical protein EOO15_08535 [Chitinophagaceae bacterium]|nr:MAG: hypothetical protein EOO15_08535 [Chitinophagaceae bacterium]
MKPLRRLLFRPILLPGIAGIFILSCNERPKHPLGQWPVKPPPGVQQASYVDAPVRKGRLRVALNGDVWEGALLYRGAELDSLRTLHCTNDRLGQIIEGEGKACFALPLFDEADTSTDFSERWVSNDFEEGGRIITEDVNFDGHRDLVLLNALQSSLSQRSYHIWLYDKARRSYFYWDLAGRTGGELLGRDGQRKELVVTSSDSEAKVFRVSGDTALQQVVAGGQL